MPEKLEFIVLIITVDAARVLKVEFWKELQKPKNILAKINV